MYNYDRYKNTCKTYEWYVPTLFDYDVNKQRFENRTVY